MKKLRLNWKIQNTDFGSLATESSHIIALFNKTLHKKLKFFVIKVFFSKCDQPDPQEIAWKNLMKKTHIYCSENFWYNDNLCFRSDYVVFQPKTA